MCGHFKEKKTFTLTSYSFCFYSDDHVTDNYWGFSRHLDEIFPTQSNGQNWRLTLLLISRLGLKETQGGFTLGFGFKKNMGSKQPPNKSCFQTQDWTKAWRLFPKLEGQFSWGRTADFWWQSDVTLATLWFFDTLDTDPSLSPRGVKLHSQLIWSFNFGASLKP